MNYNREIRLPVDRIIKSRCNQRFVLDESNVQRLTAALLNGSTLPPIFVRTEGEFYACYDGFHRLEAHRRRNLTTINAIIQECSDAEAIIISHASGTTAQWTDGEKCATYAQLYKFGQSVDQIRLRFHEDNGNDTVKKYIAIGYYLEPSLLEKCKSGGRNGSICLGSAVILSYFDHPSQIYLYQNGHCASTKILLTWYEKSFGKKGQPDAKPLFNKIPKPAPVSTPGGYLPSHPVESVQVDQVTILSRQIKDSIQALLVSGEMRKPDVATMFHDIYASLS